MPDSLVHSAEANGRGLHALIIGVGHYLHLPGGAGKEFEGHEGMRQLTSAPASARAFAEWMLRDDGYYHPDFPLLSVRLLLSEAVPAGAAGPEFEHPVTGMRSAVPPATLEEVKRAVAQWVTALNANPEHRSLLFFSGHGVSAGLEQWLLLSDYGDEGPESSDPYAPALRFNGFYLGMESVAAREQIYFLDACRSHSPEVAATFGTAGSSLVAPKPRVKHQRSRQGPVFNATLQGDEAFGRKGQPSFFTDALLDALKGGGSDNSDDDGHWKVETNILNRVVQWLVGRTARREGLSLAPINSGMEMSSLYFTYLRSPPLVPVGIACEPDEATAKARFAAGLDRKWNAAERDPLLDLGTHRFTAEFEDGAFQPGEREREVRPPYREIRIPVGR